MFIDESHITVPQISGMYNGDHSRKRVLIENGFRLPSAFDNRPLKIEEVFSKIKKVVYVSATPSDYELTNSKGEIVEQIIRPTGLVEPSIEIRKTKYQVDDLLEELKKEIANKNRVLVTTLTKKMAEELTDYYNELGLKVRYMHSDIDTIERVEIIKGLRRGEYDVLVGINLLREGLDIPEVSLVAILEADKEGYLRSRRSLIQTMGRAARNISGRVILYADTITKSMKEAIEEVDRRRNIQKEYNIKNNITPRTTSNSDIDSLVEYDIDDNINSEKLEFKNIKEIEKKISKLEKEMKKYSSELNFEKAIEVRNTITHLKKILMEVM